MRLQLRVVLSLLKTQISLDKTDLSNLRSEMACTCRYTPVEIPKSVLVQTRNAKGPPTTRTKRVISRQDWCSRARDKLKLSSRVVDSATMGKYSELVGHPNGGRFVGEALAGHPHGVALSCAIVLHH